MVVRNSFFLVGTVGLPPGLYIAGDEIVGRGGHMGGSSILYSSRGWGNSFPSRGGEQTCPPCPPPSLVVFFVVLEGGGILFLSGGGEL